MNILKAGIWRKKYFGNRTSLLLTSIVIGIITACCAVLLKNGVHYIREYINLFSFHSQYKILLFIFPALGIFLTVVYTQVFRKGDLGRGVTNIIYSISRKESIVAKDKLYSQMISGILTVGFGGSAGLEAPIASTGSAVGSRMAQWLRFDKKERTLLLACGAAAGISAIFNAPIAGVVFAFEILLVDMPLVVVAPLLIASASAAILSHLIYSGQPFILITEEWRAGHLLYYILFSFIAAFISVYAIRTYFFIGDIFVRRKKPYRNAVVGGLLLGLMIFFFPALYGEGYESVLSLMHQDFNSLHYNFTVPSSGIWSIVIITVSLMLLKVVATSFTVGAGGNGGMFGSSLFTGAMCGFSFSHIINLTGIANLNEPNFTVIGMAAFMSGIIHAPLTAIFLIAEITGGYALFVPLMIVSSITYLVSKYFEPYSVYTKKLALKGELIAVDKDKLVLSKMNLGNYLERDFVSIKVTDTLFTLVKAIEQSKRNIFPVLNDRNNLVGVILLDNVRSLIFSKELYETTFVKDLMVEPPVLIDIHESMEQVLKLFDEHNAWNLPVIENNIYKGFVSKSKIFTQYRKVLIKDSAIPA